MIQKYHEPEKFDYNIYKSKYKDLELVLKTESEYKNHWEKVGKYRRNMNKDDWKLFLVMNKQLLLQGIDDEEKLIQNNIDYHNTIFSFNERNYIDTHFDLRNMPYEQAINHFIHHGCFEGRICYY